MLIPDNVHPEATVYFNAAAVLQVIRSVKALGVIDLYVAVKTQRFMTIPMFILCLDWLFLLGVIKLNTHGEIESCS